MKCRKFTLSAKAKVFANRGAQRKSVVLLARVIIKNIKPQTHGKSQRSAISANTAVPSGRLFLYKNSKIVEK